MSPTGSGGVGDAGARSRLRNVAIHGFVDCGYVLLEVLVAAALLGVVLTVLVEGFGAGAISLAYLNDKWTAVTLARGLAAQPGQIGGAGQGRFDPPFERFGWETADGRIVVNWSEARTWSRIAGRKRYSLTWAYGVGEGATAAEAGVGAKP